MEPAYMCNSTEAWTLDKSGGGAGTASASEGRGGGGGGGGPATADVGAGTGASATGVGAHAEDEATEGDAAAGALKSSVRWCHGAEVPAGAEMSVMNMPRRSTLRSMIPIQHVQPARHGGQCIPQIQS